MSERVMIFIDGSNLYHSLKKHFGRTDLDMGKFCQHMVARRTLTRIYYYNARVGIKEEPERYKHQQAFFNSVNAIPYTELRLGRLVYNNWPSTPPYEKGTDVQLATDMLTHAFKNNYDVAILVAGDNDYVGAVQAVKDNGKHIEIALFGQEGTSRQLRSAADKVIPINRSLLKGCWKQSGDGGRGRMPHELHPNHQIHQNRANQNNQYEQPDQFSENNQVLLEQE
ncbi:MAG: NYN domain-containing protein [Dehalococcoidales bacterium]|nr:NYN domain-containing protein [Dehalococcoidales bacterium]